MVTGLQVGTICGKLIFCEAEILQVDFMSITELLRGIKKYILSTNQMKTPKQTID